VKTSLGDEINLDSRVAPGVVYVARVNLGDGHLDVDVFDVSEKENSKFSRENKEYRLLRIEGPRG